MKPILSSLRRVHPAFPPVSCRYGAPMGRPDQPPPDPTRPVKLRLARIRWTDQAYDQGGAYWGMGDPIFCAYGQQDGQAIRLYVRAADESSAVAAILNREDVAPGSRVAGAMKPVRCPFDLILKP